MKRIGPGVYEDLHGKIHLNCPEILEGAGLDPTDPENHEILAKIVREKLPADIEIIFVRTDARDPRYPGGPPG